MKNKLLSGTACAALCLFAFSGPARSATLDDVMARLDKIERENAELRAKVRSLSGSEVGARRCRAAAPVTDPGKFKGNPVLHAAVATSPAPPAACRRFRPSAAFRSKRVRSDRSSTTPPSRFTDRSTCPATSSIRRFSIREPSSESRATFPVSAFGVRHNLAPYGWDGMAVVAQLESQVDIASAPTERAAFGTRDSFLGLEGPWGAIKAGKIRYALQESHRGDGSVLANARRLQFDHGQYRRRQPRRVRLAHEPRGLVRIADLERLPVQRAVLAGPELRPGQQRLFATATSSSVTAPRPAAAAATSRTPAARFPATSAAMAAPTAPTATPTARP